MGLQTSHAASASHDSSTDRDHCIPTNRSWPYSEDPDHRAYPDPCDGFDVGPVIITGRSQARSLSGPRQLLMHAPAAPGTALAQGTAADGGPLCLFSDP